MKKRLSFLILLSGFFILIFPDFVFAQGRTGITVSPFIIEEEIRPGEYFRKEITVTNNSDQNQIFYIYINDFTAKGEVGEALLLPPGSEKFSLASWVNFPKEPIKFKPRESQKIPIDFYISEKAAPGGYYGAIIFSSEPSLKESVFAFLSQQVGVLVFLSSKEGLIEEIKVKEFKADKDFYGTPFRVNFITRIENLGNVHLKPIGLIKIENSRGKEVAILPFNQNGLNILPESIRRFDSLWSENFAFGRYSAALIFSFGTPFYQGGMGMQTVSVKTYFWIIPWNIITIAVILISFFIILGWIFLSRYKKFKRAIFD